MENIAQIRSSVEIKPHELYSPEWFRSRAFKSLKDMGNGMWDFSDSLLLYVPGTEGEYETVQQVENPYHHLVTQPERVYLESIAPDVVSELPALFEYIDLGPGTEHKEQFIFDEVKRQGKRFNYVPVDISEKFLSLSTSYAVEQGIQTHPLRVPFEELAQELPASPIPRFVSLGLTYSNYEPKQILELLKSVVEENGSAFINSQIRDRVDMDEIKKIYRESIEISRPKLQLLGLDLEKDVANFETDDGIRAWCEMQHSTPELEKMGIGAGTKLLVFQSLRTTKASLESDIAAVFPSYTMFDTNGTFIAALLKS